MYLPVKYKFLLVLGIALAWLAFSAWLALPWLDDLGRIFSIPGAWLIVTGVALLPGFASAFVLAALVLDRRPRYQPRESLPPITILVAAYNEAESIRDTLVSIVAQRYPAPVETIVCDDGSRDATPAIVQDFVETAPRAANHSVRLLRAEQNAGKSSVLNRGLAAATHELIVTVDADSLLFGDALVNIVTNLVQGPPRTAAVAGCVLVRNSRHNLITQLQEWDYFHGIAIVKRTQSLLQGTLVAQGAFSVYRRDVLRELGGWRPTVGEDIVLTWAMLGAGYRVGYAENAFVFTNVPESYGEFFRQRKRWARGMIEAFKAHPEILRPQLTTPFILFNLAFPYIDFMYLFVFVPGVIVALVFQWYAIVGLLTLLLLPLGLLCNIVMFQRQRSIFAQHGLRVRRNILGFMAFVLGYQLFLSPASLAGYASELLGKRKAW